MAAVCGRLKGITYNTNPISLIAIKYMIVLISTLQTDPEHVCYEVVSIFF